MDEGISGGGVVKMQEHEKDCLQACLTEILNIPYSEVPEFYKYMKDDGINNTYIQEYDKWLESLGYARIMFDIEWENGTIKYPVHISQTNYRAIGILHKKGRDYEHAIVLEREGSQYNYHDPKSDSDYKIEDLIQIEFIYKI